MVVTDRPKVVFADLDRLHGSGLCDTRALEVCEYVDVFVRTWAKPVESESPPTLCLV